MRVKTLYVIHVALPDASREGIFGDDEGDKGSEALVQRCIDKSRAEKIHLIRFAPYSYTFVEKIAKDDKGGSLVLKHEEHGMQVTTPAAAASSSTSVDDDVGVYVVGHGQAEGLRGIRAEEFPDVMKRLGITSIRKLCLVACNVGGTAPRALAVPEGYTDPEQPDSNRYKNYLAACCAWLGDAGYKNIKVAGWDCFVTIGYRGVSSLHVGDTMAKDLKPSGSGKLLGAKAALTPDGKKKKRVDEKIRDAHKVYYCWTMDGGVSRLARNQWSD